MHNKKSTVAIGLIPLTAFVLSAMLGGGIYNLPQNMAINAGLLGQIGGFLVSGIILWFIVQGFVILSELRPDYTTGLYQYAQSGFGNFTAFFVTWGYWICRMFVVVAYYVLLASSLAELFPGIFKNENSLIVIISTSVLLWAIIILILSGIKITARINVVGTILKLGIALFFIMMMIVVFNWHVFTTNITATQVIPSLQDKNMGSLLAQTMHSLIITMWLFGGIEGAVILSKSAKTQKDVRGATKYGFLICLLLYAFTSILPLGFRSYGQIAHMAAPSNSILLYLALGTIGRIIIFIGVIISVLDSSLTWTVILSQMPEAGAKNGNFPKIFQKTNKRGVPIVSLLTSGVVIEIMLIAAHFAGHAFDLASTIVATMTVPPYLISMLYLLKITYDPNNFNLPGQTLGLTPTKAKVIAWLAVIGIIIMGYSAGIQYLTIAFVLYAVGIPVYFYVKKHEYHQSKVLSKNEIIFAGFILIVALVGLGVIFH